MNLIAMLYAKPVAFLVPSSASHACRGASSVLRVLYKIAMHVSNYILRNVIRAVPHAKCAVDPIRVRGVPTE